MLDGNFILVTNDNLPCIALEPALIDCEMKIQGNKPLMRCIIKGTCPTSALAPLNPNPKTM